MVAFSRGTAFPRRPAKWSGSTGSGDTDPVLCSLVSNGTGGPMADVNDVLADNRAAVVDLAAAAERSAATWTAPRAPGKWSPSQVVEHVVRGLEEGANIVSGTPSLAMPPVFLRLLARLFFYRILKK